MPFDSIELSNQLIKVQLMRSFQQDQDQIVYIADPMCSWCYGFAPEIESVAKNHDLFAFKLVMGGLRPGGEERISSMGNFLREHWEQVHERSGREFSYDILENTDFVYNTEPACRAVRVVEEMNEKMAFPFFKRVQKAFYYENKDTNKTETYLELLEEFELNKEAFSSLFDSESAKKWVEDDFRFAGQLGIKGFPSVIVFHKGQGYLMSKGYEPADNIAMRIQSMLGAEATKK